MKLDLDVSRYLNNVISNSSPDVDPLEVIKNSSSTEISNVFSTILGDMHKISAINPSNPSDSLNVMVNSIVRLYTIVRACSSIEDTTGSDIEGFEDFKASTFTYCKNSLENLGACSTNKTNYKDQISEIVEIAKQYINLDTRNSNGRTQLHQACMDGDLEKIKFFLSLGANISAFDSNGRTSLYTAILNGHEECAKFIILNYSFINIAYCLNLACSKGLKEIVELLVSMGANLNSVDSSGMTPLAQALLNGKQECAIILIENKADIINPAFNNETPLELAINRGYKSIIDLLVANINAVDEDGNTMLRMAVNRFVLSNHKDDKSLKFCKFLISHGALINIRDKIGKTPLHIAAELGANHIFEELLKSPDVNGIINEQDEDDNTLLHIAVNVGEDANDEQLKRSLECVKLLIKHNARVDISNKACETPLHVAAKRDFYDAFEELLKLPKACEVIDTPDEDGNTLLHSVINVDLDASDSQRKRALECVKLLIQHNARIDIPNKAIETPLHLAIKENFYDAFEELIKLPGASAIIDKQDGYGNTLLYVALDANEESDSEDLLRTLECVKLLIKHNAKVDIPNKIGQIAIHVAAAADFTDALKELLKLPEVRELINAQDFSGDTALCTAVNVNIKEDDDEEKLERSLENVKLLIENKAKISITNKEEKTPLHVAASKGFYDALEELLKLPESREIIDVQDENGDTLLHTILKINEEDDYEKLQRNLEIVKLLTGLNAKVNISNKDGKTPLHLAAEKGFYDALEELLKLPESREIIDVQDENGDTPLHVVLKSNKEADDEKLQISIKIVKLFTVHNARVNIPNKAGKTPLHLAAEKGFYDILEEFLKFPEAKEHINAQDANGNTPLLSAIQNDYEVCADILIQNNADVNIANKSGVAPIIAVCKVGYKDFLELIIGRVNDVNVRDVYGDTPLLSAIENGHLECVEFLLDKGVDVTIADNDEITPLHLVCTKGYFDLVKKLFGKGADPNVYDKDGISPFHQSIISRNEQCTSALYSCAQITDVPNKYKNTIFSALLRNCDIPFYMQIAKKLITRNKVNLQRQDGFGNTPLHYACKQGSVSLLKLLIGKLNARDLIEKNIYYETPLQLAFNEELWKKHSKKMIEFISLILDDFSDFFNKNRKSIAKKIKIKGVSGFSSYLQNNIEKLLGKSNDVRPLIISLFLNDYALAQKIKNKLSKEQFEEDIHALSLKFSPTAEEFCKLQNFFYEISESHMSNGLIQIPEEKADGIELKDLLKMFDTLYDLHSEEITPENFRGKSKEYLREILQGFIEKVEKRKSYIGTPEKSEEREKFYNTIEIAQTHIINKLQSLTDSKRQVEILKKLIEEVHLCGGKIYTISEQLFREVCREESTTFESQLYHRLANLREMNFSAQIPSGPQSVHDSNILMHNLGLVCGIPGGQAASEFDDRFTGNGVNIDLAKIGFFKRYNSYAIASFIYEQCRDSDFMDLCLDWIVENIDIPSMWNQAWNELIQNKGKISETLELEVVQKKILKTLTDINSGEVNWEDLDDLEKSKADTFKGSQRISIDSEVMVMLLKKCDVFMNEEAVSQ